MSDPEHNPPNDLISITDENLLSNVAVAMDAIGGKWKLRIIIAIAVGNKRFNEIQKQVKGISGKVLSSELKNMAMSGLLIKKVENTYPVSIAYELSHSGQRLDEVVLSVAVWGKQHGKKIENNR